MTGTRGISTASSSPATRRRWNVSFRQCAWNRCQDAGRSFAEGARLLKAEHPEKAELIDAYGTRFDEMMAGPIAGSVEILAELKDRGTPLYGLTNWSTEAYAPALERFAFLRWFRGILVSGEVKVIKPDRRIFELLIERFGIDPHRAVCIDDVEANVVAARRLGIHAIHFKTPAELREECAVARGRLVTVCNDSTVSVRKSAKGRCTDLRRNERQQLGSADTGPSLPLPGTARFDPLEPIPAAGSGTAL